MVSGWTGRPGRNARSRVAGGPACALANAMAVRMAARLATEKAVKPENAKLRAVQVGEEGKQASAPPQFTYSLSMHGGSKYKLAVFVRVILVLSRAQERASARARAHTHTHT